MHTHTHTHTHVVAGTRLHLTERETMNTKGNFRWHSLCVLRTSNHSTPTNSVSLYIAHTIFISLLENAESADRGNIHLRASNVHIWLVRKVLKVFTTSLTIAVDTVSTTVSTREPSTFLGSWWLIPWLPVLPIFPCFQQPWIRFTGYSSTSIGVDPSETI